MKYLVIEKTRLGYKIKDDFSGEQKLYVGYTLKQAIQQHRANTNTRGKHFTKIFI